METAQVPSVLTSLYKYTSLWLLLLLLLLLIFPVLCVCNCVSYSLNKKRREKKRRRYGWENKTGKPKRAMRRKKRREKKSSEKGANQISKEDIYICEYIVADMHYKGQDFLLLLLFGVLVSFSCLFFYFLLSFFCLRWANKDRNVDLGWLTGLYVCL